MHNEVLAVQVKLPFGMKEFNTFFIFKRLPRLKTIQLLPHLRFTRVV